MFLSLCSTNKFIFLTILSDFLTNWCPFSLESTLLLCTSSNAYVNTPNSHADECFTTRVFQLVYYYELIQSNSRFTEFLMLGRGEICLIFENCRQKKWDHFLTNTISCIRQKVMRMLWGHFSIFVHAAVCCFPQAGQSLVNIQSTKFSQHNNSLKHAFTFTVALNNLQQQLQFPIIDKRFHHHALH